MYKKFILAIAAVVFFGAPAHAAKVIPKSGSVFIDRGAGYTAVTAPTEAKTGDVVIALVGGSGEVVYSDGCRSKVDVGSVVTITATSPCAAVPDGASVAGMDTTLIVGGVAVAGGVAAAIALGSGDDKPASP